MNGLKYYERITLILELIEKRKTGSPADLARLFCVTERTVYNTMGVVKSISPKKINYSADHKSYIFLED